VLSPGAGLHRLLPRACRREGYADSIGLLRPTEKAESGMRGTAYLDADMLTYGSL